MGHIVNPVGFRLGVSKYWNSVWSVSSLKNSYSYMANQDIYIQEIFWGLFHRRFGFLGTTLKNILPAGIRVIRHYNKVSLFLEFYYIQGLLLKYMLFSYFNNLFSLNNLKKCAERSRLVLTSSDIAFYKKLKPIFLQWAWVSVINPLQSKVWVSLKACLEHIFQKLIPAQQSLQVYVKSINDQSVSADFLARFIAIRLQQGVNVRKVLSTVKFALTKLVNNKVLLGFRIKLSGRFSRVQQASCSVSGGGILGRNEVISDVDYAFRTSNLKFSVCGVKVLLARPLRSSIDFNSIQSTNSADSTRWFNYIPTNQYLKWQKGNLQELLLNKADGSLDTRKYNHFL